MQRPGSGRRLCLVAACFLVGILGCKGEDEPRKEDGRGDKFVKLDKDDKGDDRGFPQDDGRRDDKVVPTDGPRHDKSIPTDIGKVEPGFKPAPNPKVLAQKKAEVQKQLALEALCTAALKKETREKAAAELQARYPELKPHVITLAVDENPHRIRQACTAIGAMGRSVKGAWPAVLVGAARMQKSGAYDAEETLVTAMDTLARIAPDVSLVVKLLLDVSRERDTVGKGKERQDKSRLRVAAVNALAEVARAYPAARAGLVTALHDAVGSPLARDCQSTRVAVIQALAPCGYAARPAVMDAVIATLGKISLNDRYGEARDAATATLAEVHRQQRIMPQLHGVGIVEGTIPAPLYDAAFALVEGKEPAQPNENTVPKLAVYISPLNPPEDEPKKEPTIMLIRTALTAAPRDDDTWFVLAALSRLPKYGAQDHVRTRQTVLALLVDWVAKDAARRKDGAIVFTTGLREPTTANDAATGLVLCGVEGVRQLRAFKTKLDVSAIFRAWLRDRDPDTRAAAAEAFGERRPTSDEDLNTLFDLTDLKQQPESVTRAAAKALLHLGPKQSNLADSLMERAAKSGDKETEKTLRRVVQQMGFDASSLVKFQESVVLSKTADPFLKGRVIAAIDVGTFRESSPKALEAYTNAWLEVYKTRFTSTDTTRRAAYSTQMRKLCQAFGSHAKQLAPIVEKDLRTALKGGHHVFTPLAAVVALEAIGPVPGVDSRGVLDQASRSSDRAVREAATQALAKFK